MVIWILFALMTAGSVVLLLRSLSRVADVPQEQAADAQFYRDQIEEIEHERAKGRLSKADAESARAEAARRLLRAARSEPPTATETSGEPILRRRRAASAIVMSIVPLIALCAYGLLGSPQLAGLNRAQLVSEGERLNAETGGGKEKPRSMEEIVLLLEDAVVKNPRDGQAWTILSHVYLAQGRFEDADNAFKRSVEILGESSELLLEYAEKLVQAKRFTVTPEAKALFERALKLDPKSLKAKLYFALSLEQEGKTQEALVLYQAVADSKDTSEEVDIARQQVERLSGKKTAAPKASPEVIAMVEGLATRLNQNGGTPEEWEQLIRSYAVLGDKGKAEAALEKARTALSENKDGLARIDQVAKDLKL